MKGEDLRNMDLIANTLRYCPNCDPKGTTPVRCLPGQCPCGAELCVLTPWTGDRTTIPAETK